MRKSLMMVGAFLALATPALAQNVNTVPQIGVINSVQKRVTYSAVALALPPAASATDIACIAASSTKNISVQQIRVSGVAGTLVSAPFTFVKRASLDTGGTPATTTANWANTIAKHDSTDVAATATLIAYSANPTINDSSPTYMRSDYLTLPTTAAGTTINGILWEPEMKLSVVKSFVLRAGTTEQYCINLNGVSVSSGLIHISIEWTEE